MMSKLRSLIVWSLVYTQVWTPVLAQTLPISVDKGVPGQKPIVGVSNGVPVVNIAPPSAGGVSNNRYTQFNVGPSGVVLNNSGGASQTQLAGQVAGNVMLGNQRATTILNQVTAPNPSQLMGTLEVAGNRANVIVANPAGITCNGCGFLNSDRATLTTGRPQIGPDGSIALEVAAGKIRVEGEGMNGTGAGQVDLIARTLEINAGVWADRLNVTAGAARVDYATGAVSAQAGEGPAPEVALDTAALGGMYANSIRLIGTEAGVGVNVGGNLVALTGDLQVSASGDVRIAPSAAVQAARDLRLAAGRDLAVDGVAQAAGGVALSAGRDAQIQGAVGAGGAVDVDAPGDVIVAAQGALQTQGALRVTAGKDLTLGGSLLMGGQDVRMESGRHVRIGGDASTPGATPPAIGGSGSGPEAGGETPSGGAGAGSGAGAGGPVTDGGASGASGGAAQAGADSSGLVTAKGGIALKAGRDMTLPAQVTAAGALHAQAGADLATGATAQLQSGGPATIRAGADLRVGGLVGARGDVSLMAGRDAQVSGKGAATGRLAMDAGRDLRLDAPAQWDAEGAVAANAGGDMALAGALRANGDTAIAAGGKLAIDGAVSAASGGLNVSAAGDVSVGAQAQVAAAGPVGLNAAADLQSFGKVTSLKDLSLQAARNLALDGETLATGDLRLQAGQALAAASASRLQADGSVTVDAGNASLAGLLIAGQSVQVNTRDGLRVDGTMLADAGTLKAVSGGDMTLGSASVLQAGRQLDAQAGGKLLADGTISGETDIRLAAGTNAELNGKTVANGALRAEAGADLTIGQAGLAQGSSKLFLGAGQDLRVAGTAGTADMGQGAEGFLQAQAARDFFVTGVVTAGTPASLSATRNLGIDGTVAALAGGLMADAGGQLRVGAAGRMRAAQNLTARSGGDLDSDGVIVAGGGLTLMATGDARLGGTAAALGDTAAGNLLLGGRDVTIKQGGQVQAAGTLTAQAGRDLVAAGALASVEDMMLTAARDARVDGTAASDANLSLTGRNVAVGAAGLAQAAGTLAATTQGTLLAAGSMLAGVTQTLTAGDDMTVDGTVAALQGDLTLETLRGNLVLGAASNQQAGGALAATAGGALQALGSAAAGQGLTLRAGSDATLGGIAAAQAGSVTVTANQNLATTADARIQAADAIDLQAGGALQNAGILSAAGAATLLAGTTLDNTGSVLAGGDANATASGALSNAGRFIAGVGEDGALSLPGSLKLTAAFITHPGISAAGKDMTLSAGGMDLSAGNLSSIGKLALASPGDIATRNAVLHGGSLDISAANLRNQGGKLTSAGDAVLKLGGELDNTTGLIAAAGNVQIEAARVGNAAGTLAGGDLTLATAGAVDNRGGLIQADETLTLNAASLDNSATLTAASAPPKGVQGKLVTIVADRVNNQGGSISASQDLTITTGELDNAGGEVAAQRYATIDAALLKNSQGKVMAGERLAIMIQALQGLGALQSAQDLSFTYTGSLNQTGDIAAGRDLSMSVGGAMDNSATVSAGRDLTITAASLNNQADGELLAGRNNTINVTNGLTNSGLIDGGATNITAGRVDNFGRIYGNTISIRAGELVNGAGPGGGAVIASRGDLDLGIGSLVNREHGLIYAGADLRIGGALDTNGQAIGQAVSLLNASATIEAAGNAAISAASLQNVNTNFVSQTLPVLTVPKLYVTPEGSTDMYDMETNWFCDQVTPMCGKVPEWLDDDPERRFLLPSDKYPASRYGPPFDYVPNKKGRAGETAPIPVTFTPQTVACSGGDNGGDCWDVPESFFYSNDAPVWAVFGVTPPSGLMPVWQPPLRECFGTEACAAEAARRQAYEDAYAAFRAPHIELDQRIREFNADFDSRLVGTFTYYEVEETVTETRTVSSDPAKILSGGAMTLTGTVTNDKSQIAAGGTLSVSGPAINNIGAAGERVVVRNGTATVTQARDSDRKEYASAYTQTLAAESIELPVGTSGGNLSVSLSGGAPGASGATAPGPVLIASIGLPGGNVVRTVSNPATIPDSQLFAVNGTPDAPYVVATDPRFVGNRPTVSCDYLFDLLQQPGAPVGNSGASGSVNAGLGNNPGGLNALIPAGAKFLTPSGQPRRLGDGFYEQKLVADQILATTGQRFLEGFGDNDSQYKQLLANGAQFAMNNGIKLGAALTEAQQRQLTTDLVWLVEQTVTLPDGTTETVLVPQVYLLVREGDLKGDGTLMAGRDVKLAADGDINNSGTIGARDATVMTAANIVNQAGGLIQGSIVDLAAREDLINLVSLIKGDNVALSAGRDIALTSTSASENHGASWGSYISGVSRVDAGNLSMQAGRDINLTAAQVTATEDARLQAGRDINLATLTQSHNESLVRNSKNRHDLSTSSEVGTVIAADGNLTLIAGQDFNARAADVMAGNQLGVVAGRDINIGAGEASASAHDEVHYKTRGFLSSKTTHQADSMAWTQAQGSTFSGEEAVLQAGRDFSLNASQVLASKDLIVDAGRDLSVTAGTNTYGESHYERVKKSGLSSGGFGISYKSSDSKTLQTVDGMTQSDARSLLGTTGGNVIMTAGRDVLVAGSDVVAGKAAGDIAGSTGNIDIQGENVAIVAGRDVENTHSEYSLKQSGFGVSVVGTLMDTVKNVSAAGSAKSKAQELGHSGATTPGVSLSYSSSKSGGSFDSYSQASSGSSLSAAGDIVIRATGNGSRDASGRAQDGDILISGSSLRAQGGVVLDAQRNIAVVGSDNRQNQTSEESSKSTSFSIGSMSLGDIGRAIDGGPNSSGVKMFPYGSESAQSDELSSGTWQTSSLITGNSVHLNSRDGDIRIAGSAIDAINNVGLLANRGSIVIDTGSATRDHSSSYSNKTVGDLGREGSGFSVGVRSSSGSLDERSSTPSAAGSTITSHLGDVSIVAMEDVLVRGSDIRAGRDLLMAGQSVAIEGSYDTSVYRQFQETSQIGVTISASNPVVSAVQSTNRMREAAQETNNGRLQAIAAVAAGLAAKNAYDAVAKDPAKVGGININVDLGASSASQTSTGQSSTASGAAISAGRDMTIIAAGKGDKSDIIVSGSDLAAGRNIVLDAQGDILLTAQQNTASQKTDGKSSSASIGVGFSIGGTQNGFSINLGAGGSKSKSNGEDLTWNNTHVQAGNVLTMNSGGDTVLRGAQVSADRILATVGGDLTVESLQDISSYTARDRSVGVQVSLCIPPICYGASSVSGNYGNTKINSQYASVTEQSGLWAGDGGFQLDVAKNTGLIGGVIASSDKAVAGGKNVLITGTLTNRDVENHASYDGQSIQLGGGVSLGGGNDDGKDKSNIGTDGKGEIAGGSKATPNSNLPSSNGVSMGAPVVAGASGEASSPTLSGISGGTIVIADEAGQKALTGQTVAEVIAGLNRDTKDTLNSLDPIFDEKEIRTGFEVVGEASRQVGQFMANRANEARALEIELENEKKKPGGGDPVRILALNDSLADAAKWGPSGEYRLIATAILGGAAGNVTGGVSDFARASAVNYLQGLTTQQVKLYADMLGDGPEAQAARAALHTVVGCGASAARGDGCGASALGAGAASVVNGLLDAASGKAGSALSPEEKEARNNLVASLLAGVALGLGEDVSGVVNSGRLETENNALGTAVRRLGIPAMSACLRLPVCYETALTRAQYSAITALAAEAMAKAPGLDDDQALLLAVTKFLAGEVPVGLPGKPGEPVPPVAIPPGGGVGNLPDTQVPGQSGQVPDVGGVPGQENNGPVGGMIMPSPLPEDEWPDLIFSESKGVPPSIVGPDGRLPAGIGGAGTPIPMLPTKNPDATAEDFALGAFNGQKPLKVLNDISGPGSWVAIMPDGTAITYRPAGQASSATADTTATVEVNSASIKEINSGKIAKFKFPLL
ncbi:hemagglutinin repeat-containing protein [Achromobacter sp. NFACC18-2]|uniref:hemagglutinin repeat-containing protein n=1 Tax=Achromobacter sp. NFACC18-2 TaxID=1564112 RepID=UPI0008B806A2|nr:hemagglutinin repeat-containing protein [Achromobacter sp. NFACC18-2]SEJ60669.1 Haemagluttinin repeat-containing protein [Achromobacter sp. NFACC18-2]